MQIYAVLFNGAFADDALGYLPPLFRTAVEYYYVCSLWFGKRRTRSCICKTDERPRKNEKRVRVWLIPKSFWDFFFLPCRFQITTSARWPIRLVILLFNRYDLVVVNEVSPAALSYTLVIGLDSQRLFSDFLRPVWKNARPSELKTDFLNSGTNTSRSPWFHLIGRYWHLMTNSVVVASDFDLMT